MDVICSHMLPYGSRIVLLFPTGQPQVRLLDLLDSGMLVASCKVQV